MTSHQRAWDTHPKQVPNLSPFLSGSLISFRWSLFSLPIKLCSVNQYKSHVLIIQVRAQISTEMKHDPDLNSGPFPSGILSLMREIWIPGGLSEPQRLRWKQKATARNTMKALTSQQLHWEQDRCKLLGSVQVIACRGMEEQRSRACARWPVPVMMKPALPHHKISRHQQTLSTAYFYLSSW